jgi:hypothetical protein
MKRVGLYGTLMCVTLLGTVFTVSNYIMPGTVMAQSKFTRGKIVSYGGAGWICDCSNTSDQCWCKTTE